jgi:hypothetical protein
VAVHLGFTDPANFGRFFRDRTGLTRPPSRPATPRPTRERYPAVARGPLTVRQRALMLRDSRSIRSHARAGGQTQLGACSSA